MCDATCLPAFQACALFVNDPGAACCAALRTCPLATFSPRLRRYVNARAGISQLSGPASLFMRTKAARADSELSAHGAGAARF